MNRITLPEASKERYVTPYLPDDVKDEIWVWRQSGKAAFIRVVPQTANEEDCRNCAGVGVVYVSFCSAGPFKYAPGSLATYFEGGPMAGAGWYTIEETKSYPCPHCQNRPIPAGE